MANFTGKNMKMEMASGAEATGTFLHADPHTLMVTFSNGAELHEFSMSPHGAHTRPSCVVELDCCLLVLCGVATLWVRWVHGNLFLRSATVQHAKHPSALAK